MDPLPAARSEFRFEKQRARAVITLVGGEAVTGVFFVARTARHDGPERIGDLLNSESGFFPFEVADGQTVLYNRSHVITVEVFDEEARRDPGYGVAKRRGASILLSNGRRLEAAVLVHRPVGRDRLSDWTRQSDTFRYVETDAATFIVNAHHIVAITEVPGS